MLSFRGFIRTAARILPSSIRNRIWKSRAKVRLIAGIAFDYLYDFKRFLKWSAVERKFDNQTQLRARITIGYHKIEKGLSLRAPRPGFGAQAVENLLSDLAEYEEKYGLDETAQIAINVLLAYYHFNLEHGLKDEQLYQKLIALEDMLPNDGSVTCAGGVTIVTKKQIHDAARCDLRPFFESRYSVRHFGPDDVDMHLIERAVAMAQKTPSVCNRQAWKVYVFGSEEGKRKVLGLQHGNRGFGEQASKVLIVTSELGNFMHLGERNQCWIDGGMYAMSLVYALHSLGLGTCCLNWCVKPEVDQKLRQVVGISDSESIIMMIAVGHLPDELKVAQSPRKKIDEVLVIKLSSDSIA